MNNALISGVSGLEAHQTMIDVAGNNLANVDTTGFKGSRVAFADLLNQTIRDASGPSGGLGGTNPAQVGSGVGVASIDRNMSQGSLTNTGQPLDMAINGAGFFTLSDGSKNVYTRVGAFAVDSQYYLVDPSTGYRVQRIGNEGVAEGFQAASSNDIRIPYDTALPAKVTSTVSYTGNLSADDTTPTTNVLTSGTQFTKNGAVASESTVLANLDQGTGVANGDVIHIRGTRRDGTAVSSDFTVEVGGTTQQLSSLVQYTAGGSPATAATSISTLSQVTGITAGDKIQISGFDSDGLPVTATYSYAAGDTVANLLTTINIAYGGKATATLNASGQIMLTDTSAGASQTAMTLSYSGTGSFQLPNSFTRITTGGTGSTVGDLLTAITNAYASPTDPTKQPSVASLVNGEIRLSDSAAGYSQTDMTLNYEGSGSIGFPQYFQVLSAGGQSSKNTNVQVFDSQGIGHTMSAAFVRSDQANKWDMVLTSITGDVQLVDRRIRGITFMADGSFGGMDSVIGDKSEFQMRFGNDPTNTRTVSVNLGTIGAFDGLSLFGGTSTAAPSSQDGYAAGWLSNLSVTQDGTMVGIFTNGVRRNVAALKLATFQNSAGLEAIGGNYFTPSANSGDPVPTRGLAGGAGSVNGGSLEKSNVEVAAEFVNLIQAQNGFQANARTIKVANDMLQALTNLIQ